jgi:hypothetical protein
VIPKVKIVQPLCLGAGSLTLLMTLVIAGLWVAQKLS